MSNVNWTHTEICYAKPSSPPGQQNNNRKDRILKALAMVARIKFQKGDLEALS